MKIELFVADLVSFDIEAIVCPAHSSFLAGSGLCGAIHKAAGKRLEDECQVKRALLYGPDGHAEAGTGMFTGGYGLKARSIIHVVVPRPAILPGQPSTERQLADCYWTILRLTAEKKIEAVAIPSLGTGVYKWPREQATHIAVSALKEAIKVIPTSLQRLVFVCPDMELARVYDRALTESGLLGN